MTKKIDYTTQLLDLSFFGKQKDELLELVTQKIENSSKLSYIVTPNPEQIVQAKQDSEFFSYLKQADFIIPDGIGLIWASRLLAPVNRESELKKRIAGREVVLDLLSLARDKRWRVLVIGGRDFQRAKVAESQQVDGYFILKNVEYSFYWIPGFDNVTSPTNQEELTIKNILYKVKPTIVFVALGAPMQEKWMFKHQQLLSLSGVKLAMAVGGSFDQILGLVPQAPIWISNLGLEWLFRLITQPWRFKRQLRLIKFVQIVLKQRFGSRVR